MGPILYFHKIFERFYNVGAVTPESAIEISRVSVKDNLFFKRTVQFGFIVNYNGKYYLDLERLKSRPLAYKRLVKK